MSSDRCRLESSSDETAYKRNQKRSVIFLVLLAVILLATILISMWAGSYDTPLNELLRGIIGRSSDQKINIVVQNVRLPRICTAAIAGAGLGVTGCILQAILNNPLASSSTLGVSQGAGFGAAFAIIILGAGSSANGNLVIPVCAFVGSMAVAIVIFALSRFCQISAESVVLAGVAISSMFTGATTLLQYFADEVELNAMVFWTFGDLGSTDWKEIGFMLVVVVVSGVYFVLHRWDFNALLSGTETATSLGIHVRRLIIVNMILCCFTASTIVSYIGLISFIGLVAPHIVRMVWGIIMFILSLVLCWPELCCCYWETLRREP